MVLLTTGGCTSLREIPRGEYAARGERKNVAVDTREGLHYEFELVRVSGDTLTGYHRRDTEGSFEEFDAVALPLDGITKFSGRHVDWYRTSLVGGGALGAAVLGAIARHHGSAGTTSDTGGGLKGGP
ncbi:MAG: hypothetical protein HY076_03425 [Candidatus Eisenbacteria bacterium]|uniref:Uncharacterized protein n=1 Tax=Eiseniibacteriota bacterium TaxID=2212470 RepID=A0A9D6L986_UNCEI|nr:hypothetical protein [Candidatus Eisenbacteria bacterium]